jgi:pimeloyl-ACP methyl ester carboxylesterase
MIASALEQGLYPKEIATQKVLFEAVEITYLDVGPKNGPTLLFVHGLGHALIAWQKNYEVLKKHYRCIVIDLPGNGLSAQSIDFPYSMEFFAEAIKDFIYRLSLEQVIIIGHSMGGQIAMTAALKNIPTLKGLILCAPAGIEQFNHVERSLYKGTMLFVDMLSTEENSLRKAINNSFFIMPDSAPKLIQQLVDIMKLQARPHYRKMMEMCIVGMLEEPVYDRLSEINVPVYIIFGERDGLIPNKIIHPMSLKQMLEKAIPQFKNASYELIPQCGHFLQWEKPQEVNLIIDSFVKETMQP